MATPYRIKRSSVTGKRPTLADLEKGELALNFYDGHLFAERDTGGVGIGTTIALLTPWIEDFGGGKITFSGNRVIIDGTNSIQIPVGTSAQRDNVGSAVTGQIRYNTSTSSFEGFGSGGAWGSLGGIKDVDQDTYITAESAAGVDEDRLTFYTAGTAKIVITPDGHVGIGTTIPTAVVDSSNSKILNVGVVTANTYHGDQIIGTPTGGSFRGGAYTPVVTEKTKDSIDELNYILGKLVPTQPDDLDGVTLVIDDGNLADSTPRALCAGFTPTNNTGGSAPSAGTEYYRNADSTIRSDYLTQYGPGDSGTVTGYVNSVGVGTTTLNISFGLYAVKSDNGTYGSIQIANDKDAAESTRNTGITSLFYEVFDVRLLDAPSPDGYNKAHITHGSATTGSIYWYEDPSTVGAPDMTFGTVSTPDPSSHQIHYSSGVPHYKNHANNAFSYVVSVENATGDMYYRSSGTSTNKLLWSEGATTGFTAGGTKLFNQFYASGVQGTHPPVRNFGVGTAVTCTVSHTPNNVHYTASSNHFNRWDVWTPYGNDQNERVTISPSVNIMGTSATTSDMDEDNILISSLGTGSGNAVRVNAGSTGDNPSAVQTTWDATNTPPAVYEAIVRGGDLRHDVTNYSSGWLPAGGPDLSSGRSGSQYFQVLLTRTNVSQFNITYTGNIAGCWVCMPDNSAWNTSLSSTNGWADMFQVYVGAGVPSNANPGCSTGGAMDDNGGTTTCTFGTESSSNGGGKILVRWKLNSGDSINTMSFAST